MSAFWFVFLILFHFHTKPVKPSFYPDSFTKSLSFSRLHNSSLQYFEVGLPLPSDRLTPSCTVQVLRHSFANTINCPPFSTPYTTPSDCPSPWSHVFLDFRAKCKGEQYDRIAGLWLGGVELLRTSTAEPNPSGISWNFRKDITKYSSTLSLTNLNVTMMLENIVNTEFTGVYHVEVDFLYYNYNTVRNDDVRPWSVIANRNFARNSYFKRESLGLDSEKIEENFGVLAEEPADLIIPVSDTGNRGFWFRIESESDLHLKDIQIPKNTRRAVLELYVSFHGNDEFWYSNPPNSYIIMNNLTTGRANGAYREVFVTIDGVLMGSEIPFPVIFTGGINPLFWEPVVAIGAFNLPSYDLELTSFLGMLVDGNVHTLGVGVAHGISYWLVDANLHLWLDHNLNEVEASWSSYQKPSLKVETESEFEKLDGSFKIESERKIHSVGWVKWSGGNYTTKLLQEYKFKNSIQFNNNGTRKEVKQKIMIKREVRVENEVGEFVARTKVKREYPLNLVTATLPGLHENTYLLVTNVSHSFKEKSFDGKQKIIVDNTQDCEGWMEVQDHSVLDGKANTKQSFDYKDGVGCYSRLVEASNGNLTKDETVTSLAMSLYPHDCLEIKQFSLSFHSRSLTF